MRQVTELIEVVFEKVKPDRAVDLLIKFITSSTLESCNISADAFDIDLQSKEKLYESIKQSTGGSFYFNFKNFKWEDVRFLEVGFQIIKYDNVYDLCLIFAENEIRRKISIPSFHSLVSKLAVDLDAANYYCGYEPALNEETRIFSKNRNGPLSNWGSMDR